jgi:hypothetical protein
MMLQHYCARFDSEASRIGKPLMGIPRLIFYFHANSASQSEMAKLDGKGQYRQI